MNTVVQYGGGEDDGFGGSLTEGRLIRGQLVRWNETNGWTDRDGLRPPETMLAVALSEALQRWKDKKLAETIVDKPLPSIDDLNAAIPQSEWSIGLSGKPEAPWKFQYVVYLLDPVSGGFFTYINSTIGARIAHESLRERTVTMRMLRGAKVVPVVRLSHRPMKTFVGMKHRPEFEIVDWRRLGDDGGGPLPGPRAPRITGPATPAPSTTLDAMEQVSEPPLSEIMGDEIKF